MSIPRGTVLITTRQRVYLACVAILGLWVGVFCYFVPTLSDWGIPWLLPPLCATFLGSMYLSGGAITLSCMRSRRWSEIRAVMPMIAIWTGGLTVVSLFYLPAYDWAKTQVWVWFGAYISFPLIAMGLMWRHRAAKDNSSAGEPQIEKWVKAYLIAQGTMLTVVSLALLFAPGLMQSLWPWKTGLMMLQLYSAPFLSYGLGSFILARQRNWSEIRNAVMGMSIFMGGELAASLRFRFLFDGAPFSIALWFGALTAASGVLALLSTLAHRREVAQNDERVDSRLQLRPVGD